MFSRAPAAVGASATGNIVAELAPTVLPNSRARPDVPDLLPAAFSWGKFECGRYLLSMLAVALVGVADSLLPAHRLHASCARRNRVVVAEIEPRGGGSRVSAGSPINVEAPGINGGDPWAGARGSDDDLKATVDEAVSETVYQPVIPQFYPSRLWLWRRWKGTILQRVLPGEVFWNSVFTALFILAIGRIRSTAAAAAAASVVRKGAWRVATAAAATSGAVSAGAPPALGVYAAVDSALGSVDKVWGLASGLVTFTLSFFLTQSYNFWREVYGKARAVQGRLNDIGMLCATSAARHADGPDKGQYTAEALQMLLTLGRCARGHSTYCSACYGSTLWLS